MVPDPKPFRDGLIAATALVHSLVEVTRNLADFEATGVPLLNPWRRGRADQPRWRPTPAHAHRAHAVPVGLEGTVGGLAGRVEECCRVASGEGMVRVLLPGACLSALFNYDFC